MNKTWRSALLTLGIFVASIGLSPIYASDSTPVFHSSGALSTLLDTTGTGMGNFYISAPLQGSQHWRQGVPQLYEFGASWYSSMYPISTTNTQGIEIGLNSTWITSDNRDKPDSLGREMCKAGANDHFRQMTVAPNAGNAGLVLFQTIEGSMGWWGPTHFPSIFPKYLPNVTQNCYQTLEATPGWGFYGDQTPKNQTGVIQLSNRILMPPDGLTFKPDYSGTLLGTNWQALKLPSFDHVYSNMAGNNNWTLFLKTQNFSGPIAFIAPQYWSDGALSNPAQLGLGLDHNPGMADLMASEWETVPYLSYTDSSNNVFSKIPNISLPLDSSGKFILGGDFSGYTERTDTFSEVSTFKAKLTTNDSPLYQSGIPIKSLKELLTGKTFSDSKIYGFQFPTLTGSSYEIGPYFQQKAGEVVPVAQSEVPSALVNTRLPESQPDTHFVYSTPSWWNLSSAASNEYTTNLSDGSIAVYRWFKFVDQPALTRFELSDSEKNSLQLAVVKIQQTWGNNALMDNPSFGSLTNFDNGILVKPPKGMDYGYVPIVVKQYATESSLFQANQKIFEECKKYSATNHSVVCTQPLAPRPVPSPRPSMSNSSASANNVTPGKKIIFCSKGNYIKKVTGFSPKCPIGYHLK